MEFQVRLFNNTSANNQFKLNLPESSPHATKATLFKALTDSLHDQLHLPPDQFVILSKNGVKLGQESFIENGQMLQICPTVLGGKVNPSQPPLTNVLC